MPDDSLVPPSPAASGFFHVCHPEITERLRAEMADQQSHREQNAERAGRVASVLQDGGRLDPEDVEQAVTKTWS